jgi:hypothetical protein
MYMDCTHADSEQQLSPPAAPLPLSLHFLVDATPSVYHHPILNLILAHTNESFCITHNYPSALRDKRIHVKVVC